MHPRPLIPLLYLAVAGAVFACGQTSPPPLTQLPAYQPSYGEGFSAQRCWHDLETLTAIGPRVTGTEGSRKAREYIEGQLEGLGLAVKTREVRQELGEGREPLVATDFWADIPGESSDLIVLTAPYDTRPFESFAFVGANDGGSGAALLIELGRALVQKPIHYTVRLLFLDGEAPRPSPEAEGAEIELIGSRALANDFVEQALLPRIRLLVFFNQVADADLRIARDLYSHRHYREEFWEAAQRLDQTQAFPPERFESVPGSHHSFRAVGLSRVVAIVDTSYGGDEPPGVYANSEEDTLDHLSPESLRIVGEVTLDALDHVSQRLAKIDRFSRAPLEEESPAPSPPPPPAPQPETTGAEAATPSDAATTSDAATAEEPKGEVPAGGSSAAEWEGQAAPPAPADEPKPPPAPGTSGPL